LIFGFQESKLVAVTFVFAAKMLLQVSSYCNLYNWQELGKQSKEPAWRLLQSGFKLPAVTILKVDTL
jgi:hypothetical protein